jgi:16S rRNA (guanine966-N2)-methyltransferase
MIRILNGKWKGQYLKVPDGKSTRPTSAARKEALFNILEHGLAHNCERVLDLFAGTGSLSFEALSRTAHRAVMIEKDPKALLSIKENIERLQISPQTVSVIASNRIKEWPLRLSQLTDFLPFDTIFCDPPYGLGLVEKVIPKFEAVPHIFSDNAVLIVEMDEREDIPIFKNWEYLKERGHGEGKLIFFRRKK